MFKVHINRRPGISSSGADFFSILTFLDPYMFSKVSVEFCEMFASAIAPFTD
jgi:hypothetical protein